ncbi:hypothetical protein ACHAW5_003350 [Stephanodiscus triporus]|uniref:UBA domain-containing protein n=1 Tax=Stephanodiscus triporus TaxID=2934178 RepID=A0ABD3N0S7_9STRA
MSLDAYACPVASSRRPATGGGDPTASTSSPPAEFVLATCGGGGRLRPAAAAQRRSHRRQFDDDEDGCAEVVTLWAVSTARRRRLSSSSLPCDGDDNMDVSPGGDVVDECDDRDRDAPLELIVRRLDHLTIDNVGADASLFLSDFAAERWSCASTEDDGHDDRERPSSSTTTGSRKRKGRDEERTISSPSVAVVTVAAPVVMLRFTPPSGNSCGTGSGVEDKVLLAALDYNGGVSVLDCTASIRMATITEKNDDKNDPPYVHDGSSKRISLFCSRDCTMAMPSGDRRRNKSSSKGGIMMASASQIEWWSPRGGGGDGTISRHEHPNAGSAVVGEVSHSSSFTLVTYATLLTGQKKNNYCFLSKRTKAIVRMQRWSWSSGIAKGHDQHIPCDVFCMPIFSSGGNASSIALLPMLEMPRQRQQNGHPSLFYHEMMPFLRLSADIVPAVADDNKSNTTDNNPVSSSAPTPPPQCRLNLSICGIKRFSDPAEIIAALLRRGDASKAIGVARRFGIDDEGGQRNNYDLGEEGRLMMNQCRIQLWEDRRDVHALTLISDDAYVIGQALELLQCRDCCGRISGDRGVRDDIIVKNEGLSLADLSKTFREALTRCDALGGEESSSNARQLRDAVRRIGTFKLLLNHYVDKATASNADAATGFSSNEQPKFERRFLKDFTHESLYDIAACAASKGDIDALTVLIVRHPLTMSERMQLLDLIPFEVDIALYEHLLPCNINEDIHGDRKDSHSFLLRRRSHLLDNNMFLSPLLLFTHMSDLQLRRKISGANNSEGIPAIDIFIDDPDRNHVMLHFEEGSNDDSLPLRTSSSSTKADVATWYLKRAVGMHNRSGQVLPVKELCAAGLARLGLVSFTTENRAVMISDFNNISVSSMESQAVGKLIYLYSAASFFCRILADKLTSMLRTVYVHEGQEFQESLSNESFGNIGGGLFLSVVQFCSMDLKDSIPYILENSNISMFQKHFAHTVNGGECLEPRNNGVTVSYAASENMSGRLECDMMDLCLNKIKRLRTSKNANSSTLQPSLSLKLEESLSLCADFALFWGGAHPKSRIAQNEDCLIEFLKRIFNSALDVMEGDWDILTEGVIGKLWRIFEMLPYTTPRESDGQHSASTIYKEAIGGLHFRLVALQLCCKWHGRQTFPSELWNLLHTTSDKEEDKCDNQSTRDICLAGRGVISIMCGGFCERAAKMSNPNGNDRVPHLDDKYDDVADPVTSGALAFKDRGLLFDFISDIDEFDGRFFSAGAQRSGCIGMFFFSPLLYQHSFVMLKNILKIRPSWFCQNFTCSIVATFIRDAATSKNKDANVMPAYREILGQVFPNLCAEFDHQQRMIAAKEFMAVVMKLDDILLGKLCSIIDYSAKPIDLMRALIEMDAPAILLGCEFWGDKMSACAACTDASLYFSSQIRGLLSRQPAEHCHVLPPMPGARVIQLANLIGLYASRDILLVKHLMVNGALRMNLGPAAVAICYSMLCDIAASRRENNADSMWASSHDFQVIDCIAAILKSQSFCDLPIKRDLCTIALQLFSMADSPLYCVLLDIFKDLEYEILALEMSSLNDDSDQLSGRTNDFFVFKTAELVASLVDNLNKNSDIPMKRNNFYDQSMSRVFREIKKSSQADLMKKLCRIGRQAVDDDNTSLAVSISEAIFQWVVAETFLARKSLIPLSLPIAKIFMMTELGLSCLLEFQGQDKSLNMKRTFQDFKAKSRLPIAQNIAFPESTAQPDMSIIQRLCDRGYGRHAARRAVIMTDNQGYSAALTWAVSHFSDADFDSPLFFLRSDTTHVDQCLVDMVDKLLQSVQNRVKVKWSQTDTSKHDLTSEAATSSKALDKSYGSSILPKKSISSKIPCQSPFASPLSSSERDQDMDYSSLSNSATASGVTELAHATALTKTTFVSNLPSMTKASLPHKSANMYSTKMAVDETPMISAARPPPRNSPDSASSVEGSLSSRASIKNQIKLGRARFETQKLSLEERKKLAIEGKRLLSAARAQRKNVLAPPTTITTSKPPPAFEG